MPTIGHFPSYLVTMQISGGASQANNVDSSSSSSSLSMSPVVFGNGFGQETVSPTVSEDGVWKCENSQSSVSNECMMAVSEDYGFEGCSLARIPSFDPDLIWEVLAN